MLRTLIGLCIIALSLYGPANSDACVIRFATGAEGGFYQAIFHKMNEMNALNGCRLVNVPSEGSHRNLELMASDQADLTLVQADTLMRAQKSLSLDQVELLSSSFFESIHLLSRTSLKLNNFQSLIGMKLWIGSKESGSRDIARDLLDVFSLPSGSIYIQDSASISHIGEAFHQRHIDAALVTSYPSAPWIETGLQEHSFMVNTLAMKDIKTFLDRHDDTYFEHIKSTLRLVLIEKFDRKEQELNEYLQLAIPTLVLARKGLPKELQRSLVMIFNEALTQLNQDAQLRFTILGAPIKPQHFAIPTSSSFKATTQEYIDDDERIQHLITFTLVLFLIALFMIRKVEDLRVFIFNRTLLFSFILTVSLCLISTLGTYLSEHSINENFTDIQSSFWSILIYLFSGLEDREPYSTTGKLFSIIAIVTGPLIIAFFSGAVASTLIQNLLGAKMPSNLKNHYVLINESNHIPCIVKELRAPLEQQQDRDQVIVILLSNQKEDISDELKSLTQQYSNIYFSYGDPSTPQVLKNVQAHLASSVLILSPEDGDNIRPLQTLVALKSLLIEEGNKVHATIELSKPQMVTLISEISKGFPGSIDYLAQGELNSLMLSQSILNPGLTGFYRDLISVSGDNNEAYMITVPDKAIGMSFSDYARLLIDQHHRVPYILVGIKRPSDEGYTLVCNPRENNDLYSLSKGDYLVLLSYVPPNPKLLPLYG